MTAKHTPGPWKIRELTCEDHRGMGWVEDANGRDIACCGAAELWLYENRANAALIARAPELLAENDKLKEQLREMVEALRKAHEELMGFPIYRRFDNDTRKKLEALLAKYKGEA